MATLDLLYQSQITWTQKEFNTLYFVLNKAIYNEQDYLGTLDPNLMTNTTKAIIKSHIDHYARPHLYDKFPNLQTIKYQKPLLTEVILIEKFGSNSLAFSQMNLRD